MEKTQSHLQISDEFLEEADFQGGHASWYALRTKPRHEKVAAMMLSHKGYESLLPLYQSRRPRPGRFRDVELPIFPGYLFCQFDVNARLPILTTPGVLQVVGLGRTPIPVKETEIQAIRRLVQSPLHAEPWPFVEVGQTVYVQEGPLQGVEGILLAIKNAHRLVLSVTLLQRSIAVEIERASVVPTTERRSQKAD